jgi:DNA-binding CsgD family transcriptional regulator
MLELSDLGFAEASTPSRAWRGDTCASLPTVQDFGRVAVIEVDGGLHVLTASPRAERLLPISGRDGLLRLLSAANNATQLRRLFREAVTGLEKRLILIQPGDRSAILCRIVPVPEQSTTSALVFLSPLLVSDNEVVPHLRSIYGLSQAEAEVAAAVGAGLDVVQIAHERGVSIHTLRAQVASIKIKMALSRMTEIAVRVSSIAAATALF